MHPVLSHRRRFLTYCLVAVFIGLLFAEALVWVRDCRRDEALLFAIPVTLLTSWMLCSAYYVCSAFPLQNRALQRTLAVFLSSALISAAMSTLLMSGWHLLLRSLGTQTYGDVLGMQFLTTFFASVCLLYLISLLAYDILIAFEDIRQAELRSVQSMILAREAELQVLRSQIDPHFLFNSLNSISALTAIDASAARDMTIALADFFRLTLVLASRPFITLEEEWKLCEHFLAVEQIRFGDKLRVNNEIEAAALSASVPPMILQPLLENAIKHGIRHLRQGGVIQVDARVQGQWLYLAVSNPVAANSQNMVGNKLGLANLRQRFSALYHERAQVSWQKTDSGFTVNITLPLEHVAHDSSTDTDSADRR